MIDLDALVLPDNPHGDGREVFDPDPKSAWPDASDRVYVSTTRCGADAILQVGVDTGTAKTYFRVLPTPTSRWGDWQEVDVTPTEETAPPPEGETGEGEGEGSGEGAARRTTIRKK